MVDRLDGAFTLYTEGDNGQWGYWGSLEYMKLQDNGAKIIDPLNGSGLKLKGELQVETVILDAGLTLSVTEHVDLLAGARYWNLENQLRGSLLLGNTLARGRGINDSQTILDGFVGARVTIPFDERWSSTLRVDAGAGDSDSTCQAIALLNYAVNERWTTSAGYRYLSVDFEEDGYVFDMANEGIEFAVTYSF